MPDQNQPHTPTYEETKARDLDNLARFENFRYSASGVSGERGQEGTRLAYFGTREALRRGEGMEGILQAYDAQVANAVGGLGGVNAPLIGVIGLNSQIYTTSLNRLKIADILPYLKERMPNVDLIEDPDFMDMTLPELQSQKGDKARVYREYLNSRIQKVVEFKVHPLALEEQARFENEQLAHQYTAMAAGERQQQGPGRRPGQGRRPEQGRRPRRH